ncbi:glycosyl hydrolase family 8 [Azospirillum oleiclasticum]
MIVGGKITGRGNGSVDPGRRALLGAGAAGMLAAVLPAPARGQTGGAQTAGAELDAPSWHGFAGRFLGADGRVTDTGNGGISHSEGQGYGLVLATAARDRGAVDRLWGWTKRNLMVRPDGLSAWKWESGKGVTDPNNATDGDILIAWGLLRAAELWKDADLRGAALALLQAIRQHTLVRQAGMTLPLPGVTGFRRGGAVIVNPSYLIMPAFQAFAAAEPSGGWDGVIGSALVFLAKARIGQGQLPPDWALLAEDGSLTLPDGFRKQFGYDAIRVPLYLAWAGYRDPWYFRPYGAFAAPFGNGPIPATVSLPGGTTAQVPASVGMLAVLRLATRIAESGNAIVVPPLGADEDYYSTVLFLLTRLAERSLGLSP